PASLVVAADSSTITFYLRGKRIVGVDYGGGGGYGKSPSRQWPAKSRTQEATDAVADSASQVTQRSDGNRPTHHSVLPPLTTSSCCVTRPVTRANFLGVLILFPPHVAPPSSGSPAVARRARAPRPLSAQRQRGECPCRRCR